MTEKEARSLTKYFGEGVRVSIWSLTGSGAWELHIERQEGRTYYYGLDVLKRELIAVADRIKRGDKQIEFYRERYEYPEDILSVEGAQSARDLVAEMQKAVEFIMADGRDPAWRDVSKAEAFATVLQEHVWFETMIVPDGPFARPAADS